jgi:hypothetical protein
LGNLFKAKLTLVFGNSLKIDELKFDLLEENFPISHFQNPKLITTRNCLLLISRSGAMTQCKLMNYNLPAPLPAAGILFYFHY